MSHDEILAQLRALYPQYAPPTWQDCGQRRLDHGYARCLADAIAIVKANKP